MTRFLLGAGLLLAGCGGSGGRVEVIAKIPGGVLSVARAGSDLWVGTADGLVRLPGGRGPAESFGTDAGLEGGRRQVRWIHPRDRDLLLATGAGIAVFSLADRKVIRSWAARDGVAADSVRWVGESGGRIWAGTIFGASRLGADGRTWRTWKIAQGLSQDHVYRMHDDGSNLWASCMNGGLARFDRRTERFTPIPQVRGLGNTHLYAMVSDPVHGLWLGTAGGVNLYHSGSSTWDPKVCEDGFTDYTVYAVLPRGGAVWFGTAFGLSRRELESGRQRDWDADHGLPHSEVVGLLPDEGGVIVATKLGLARVAD